MNNLEIQREAIIEIVGTQYEGRSINHRDLVLHQSLIMKHQKNNIHDPNAVLILTEDYKELGFMPKGYASLYAPAIESGNYSFTVEVVKAELDFERPILIVRVVAEYNNFSAEETENRFIEFVQMIVNNYSGLTIKYMNYINRESVDIEELLFDLNNARLMGKLYSVSNTVIENNGIIPNAEKCILVTNDSIIQQIKELKTDISGILKIIKKEYIESLDIDDENEYRKAQIEIRKKRKKFRLFDDLCISYLEAIENFIPTVINTSSSSVLNFDQNSAVSDNKSSDEISAAETTVIDLPHLTEQDFEKWLVSCGEVTEKTARQYISNMHSMEKLYQTIFGERKSFFGTVSIDNIKSIIENLIQRSEYIDANERRHNSFSAALNKYAQFANFTIDGSTTAEEKKSIQSPISSSPFVIKTVDFENPHDCTYYKPNSFIFDELKYSVDSWKELYTKFLTILYNDNRYFGILDQQIGKPLYGRRIDFADRTLFHVMRKPIKVSDNFFAEGNLSAVDIIKHIKSLMDLCSIDSSKMLIEYNTQEQACETFDNTVEASDSEQQSNQKDNIQLIEAKRVPEKTLDFSQDIHHEVSVVPEVQVQQDIVSSFLPDTSKPFVLKEAVIEILSSDSPEINSRREYKNGISSKVLGELLKTYYKKSIGVFGISKLLMLDRTFKSVGRGCFILNPEMISNAKPFDEQDNATRDDSEKPRSIPVTAATSPRITTDSSAERFDDSQSATNTAGLADKILDIIRQNKNNLQYEDGFGSYEIKNLLKAQGVLDVSENEIESLMTENDNLKEVEDGYFVYVGEDDDNVSLEEKLKATANDTLMVNKSESEPTESVVKGKNSEGENIILNLNGSTIRAYDYSDALIKICEFAINCKPFRMARIDGEEFAVKGNKIFYRKAISISGYNKLSNGLQVVMIDNVFDLQKVSDELKKYCQIDNDLIVIINE